MLLCSSTMQNPCWVSGTYSSASYYFVSSTFLSSVIYFIFIVSKRSFLAHHLHSISVTPITLFSFHTFDFLLFLRGGFSGFSESDGYEPIQLTVERVADIHHSGGKSVKSRFTALFRLYVLLFIQYMCVISS